MMNTYLHTAKTAYKTVIEIADKTSAVLAQAQDKAEDLYDLYTSVVQSDAFQVKLAIAKEVALRVAEIVVMIVAALLDELELWMQGHEAVSAQAIEVVAQYLEALPDLNNVYETDEADFHGVYGVDPVDQLISKQVAVGWLQGKTASQIAGELGLPEDRVATLLSLLV